MGQGRGLQPGACGSVGCAGGGVQAAGGCQEATRGQVLIRGRRGQIHVFQTGIRQECGGLRAGRGSPEDGGWVKT